LRGLLCLIPALMAPKANQVVGTAVCAVGLTWTGSAWLLPPANYVQPALHDTSSPHSQTEALAMHGSIETTTSSHAANTSMSSVPLLIGSSCIASAILAQRRRAQVHLVAREALPTPSAVAEPAATKIPDVAADALAEAIEEPPAPPPPPPPFNPAKAIGVTAPLGYFDPLGFCKVGDYAGFHNLRSAELKHGRVAMMAAVGTVFAHYVKFPGFDKVSAGLAALKDPAIVSAFFILFPVAGFIEIVYWKDEVNKEPGNFGDPAGWGRWLGVEYNDELRNKEINNGRMAMLSILGIFMAELVTGKDGMQQFGLP